MSLLLAVVVVLSLSAVISSLPGGGQVQWRYSSYGADSQQLLSYKNRVHLQTSGNVSLLTTSCTTVDIERPLYTVMCMRPGIHQAELHSSDNHSENSLIYIPLDNTPYCYSWGVRYDYSVVNSTSEILLHVWVQDQAFSDHNGGLSTQFNSLGETPSVAATTPGLVANLSLDGFNHTCSYWSFVIRSTSLPYEFAVHITGRNTIIFDCGVRPTEALISRLKFRGSVFETSSNISIVPSSVQDLHLYQDPQVSGTAVLLHGDRCFITQNDFNTIHRLQIANLPAPIDEVAMTDTAMVVLVNGSVFVLPNDGTNTLETSVFGVDHISTGGQYQSMDSNAIVGGIVTAWNSSRDSFYLSTNGGMDFREVTLQSDVDHIHAIVVHPSLPEVEVLVSSNNSTARVCKYDITSGGWGENGYNFSYTGGHMSAQFFPSVFGELLIWEDTSLYHSPNGGLTVSPFPVYSSSNDSVLSPYYWGVDGDYIKQVTLGPGGTFAVISSMNRLFYGTTSVGYGIEIQSGESPDSSAVVVFNSIGELKLISTTNGELSVHRVPTHSLLLSALYPPPACPYLQWEHNIEEAVYYLDSREQLNLWASVIPGQWESNQISVLSSTLSSVTVNFSQHLTQTALEGSMLRNVTVHIQPRHTESVSNSRMSLKMSASSQNLACPEPAETVTLVSVQCPPSRHIRIKRPASQNTNCPSYDNFSYKIRKGQYDPELRGRSSVPGNTDKVVEYNVTMFGCPIRLPYSSSFKPVLELYDGDELVEEVDGDFVVWEINGRTDFRYTATARRVKCLSAPQNWLGMLENGTHPSMAWTPQSYRSCFESGGETLVRSAPYEVLNKTGGSSLVWQGYNGIYTMAAQVVAPGYSYCNLTVYFAVEVYGAVSYAYIGYILLVLTCLASLTALLTTYYCYRHMLKSGIKKMLKTE